MTGSCQDYTDSVAIVPLSSWRPSPNSTVKTVTTSITHMINMSFKMKYYIFIMARISTNQIMNGMVVCIANYRVSKKNASLAFFLYLSQMKVYSTNFGGILKL